MGLAKREGRGQIKKIDVLLLNAGDERWNWGEKELKARRDGSWNGVHAVERTGEARGK